MNKTTRREFLHHSAETVTLAAALSSLGGMQAWAAEKSDKVRLKCARGKIT
ncbi:MAG: hypothetical protein ACKVT0_16650 [Planctomycetaceae bacterium]